MITRNSNFIVTTHHGFDCFFICYLSYSPATKFPKRPLLQSYPFRLQLDSCERCKVGKLSIATHGYYTSDVEMRRVCAVIHGGV
jgi:hypothetical protein